MNYEYDKDLLLEQAIDNLDQAEQALTLIDAIFHFIEIIPVKTPNIEKVAYLLSLFQEVQTEKLTLSCQSLDSLRKVLRDSD